MTSISEPQVAPQTAAEVPERMPRAVRLGLTLALALLMMGALYLVAVRGEALLVDLSTLGQRLWCF
ncbi:MAG: hypothetical protein J0I57_02850 [Hyphomicrobium sp.]|uniref:hypothetical protein n=1 Tax=Hyphomicrobium sp. CS1BSMeth3 TaxID=1892844 RepID=UPI00086D6F75|nr:hypothetical protein [Hyphomicrobium sp. CS1BSMeth3]MBN9261329.1 hypothetical protein [Hyphomicrobium sp.]ODT20755.1 MAG: hypothetical protein ABS54_13735 [Hyphomicrobium sp. SCN 65-11]OJU28131.1 MAG: hypothetical protein BGN89_02360 [Alphaproteobacteria bacterium 64-6]MBN9265591.1 hypothetical protein [Hyphomicrobium sp.]MBN9276559.1 hypothetical protein [Hyphomicrobium sp.]